MPARRSGSRPILTSEAKCPQFALDLTHNLQYFCTIIDRPLLRMPNDSQRVSLADAIAALRSQIRAAGTRAQGIPETERFKITEAEIELTVVAEGAAQSGVEVGWWVFKANANVSVKEICTHKVRIKLDLGDIEVGSLVKTK